MSTLGTIHLLTFMLAATSITALSATGGRLSVNRLVASCSLGTVMGAIAALAAGVIGAGLGLS